MPSMPPVTARTTEPHVRQTIADRELETWIAIDLSPSLDFGTALKEAQDLGYAEPDPTNDVEGIDAAYKLSILSTLAFHARVHPDQVYREGITGLQPSDFRYARDWGT